MQIGPRSNLGCRLSRYVPYSTSKRITMYQQSCLMLDGTMRLYNLKLYMKNTEQRAKTVGAKKPYKFTQYGKLWRQI